MFWQKIVWSLGQTWIYRRTCFNKNSESTWKWDHNQRMISVVFPLLIVEATIISMLFTFHFSASSLLCCCFQRRRSNARPEIVFNFRVNFSFLSCWWMFNLIAEVFKPTWVSSPKQNLWLWWVMYLRKKVVIVSPSKLKPCGAAIVQALEFSKLSN